MLGFVARNIGKIARLQFAALGVEDAGNVSELVKQRNAPNDIVASHQKIHVRHRSERSISEPPAHERDRLECEALNVMRRCRTLKFIRGRPLQHPHSIVNPLQRGASVAREKIQAIDTTQSQSLFLAGFEWLWNCFGS